MSDCLWSLALALARSLSLADLPHLFVLCAPLTCFAHPTDSTTHGSLAPLIRLLSLSLSFMPLPHSFAQLTSSISLFNSLSHSGEQGEVINPEGIAKTMPMRGGISTCRERGKIEQVVRE